MKRRHPALPADELREQEPDGARGSYPPDIARRRRQLGLPVTPEEHAAYKRGEFPEPPATRAQMQDTLRRVLPRVRPGPFRAILLDLVGRQREPGEDDDA